MSPKWKKNDQDCICGALKELKKLGLTINFKALLRATIKKTINLNLFFYFYHIFMYKIYTASKPNIELNLVFKYFLYFNIFRKSLRLVCDKRAAGTLNNVDLCPFKSRITWKNKMVKIHTFVNMKPLNKTFKVYKVFKSRW